MKGQHSVKLARRKSAELNKKNIFPNRLDKSIAIGETLRIITNSLVS